MEDKPAVNANVTAVIPRELYEEFAESCRLDDRTMSNQLKRMIREYLETKKKKAAELA